MLVRDADEADLPAIMAIHNDVVRTTTAIYEDRITEMAEWRAWFDQRQSAGLPVIVAEDLNEVAGYASYGPWRSRSGYRRTVENTVHVRAGKRGRGIGRTLMEALIAIARERDIHVIVAQADSSAAASLRLHQSLGFELVGTFREVAEMRGRWLTLIAMQLILSGDAREAVTESR